MEDNKSSSTAPDFLVRIETKELEELSQHIKDADIELNQAGRTVSPSKLFLLSFDNLHLQVGSYGSASISNATSGRERVGLLYKIDKACTTRCNGYQMENDKFIVYGSNAEHIAYNDGPCKWAYLTLNPAYFEEHLLDPVQGKMGMGRGTASCLNCQDYSAIGTLLAIINEIAGLVERNSSLFRNSDVRTGMEYSLLEAQIAVLGRTPNIPVNGNAGGKKSHTHIIKRSIDLLKANSYKPIHVTDLCSTLNVRMRTLYYAFQEFYGTSPIQFLRLLRFAKARKDLLGSDPKRTTVTDVAARWHFWHFGRFSVEYKALYGESPSETLNKAR